MTWASRPFSSQQHGPDAHVMNYSLARFDFVDMRNGVVGDMGKIPVLVHYYEHSSAEQDMPSGFFADSNGKPVVGCDDKRTKSPFSQKFLKVLLHFERNFASERLCFQQAILQYSKRLPPVLWGHPTRPTGRMPTPQKSRRGRIDGLIAG